MLQHVTAAHDPKQKAALIRSLGMHPRVLYMLPETVQSKAYVLQEQLQQQLDVDPERTQQLISKHPRVLEFLAESLVQKAKEQGQLLGLEAADVVTQLWMRSGGLFIASTQLLHERLAQLHGLLQPYMSAADVRHLVIEQPRLTSYATSSLQVRMSALEECLPDWTPQQLGAAVLIYHSVLTRSPDTIRYKWHVLSRYRDIYMPGTQQQEEQRQQQQQQQQQPYQSSELCIFTCTKERFAMLEYIMEQQHVPDLDKANFCSDGSSSSGDTSSVSPESSVEARCQAPYMPPASIVLRRTPRLFKQLVQEHYPGFWLWYKQRQQQDKQKQQ
jgi:hypothetical protein